MAPGDLIERNHRLSSRATHHTKSLLTFYTPHVVSPQNAHTQGAAAAAPAAKAAEPAKPKVQKLNHMLDMLKVFLQLQVRSRTAAGGGGSGSGGGGFWL